jgi:hypothetical protein
MNLFDLGGQYLRVGRAITPPNALLGPSSGSSVMPTAAAVAAAAATAKIQAMDAVASNAVALGFSKLSQPVVTPAPGAVISPPAVIPAVIPPPGLAIPQVLPNNTIQPTIVTPVVSAVPQTVIAPPTIVAPTLAQPTAPVSNNSAQEAMKRAQEAQMKQQEELQKKLLDQNEPQTLQQQENMSDQGAEREALRHAEADEEGGLEGGYFEEHGGAGRCGRDAAGRKFRRSVVNTAR